MKESLQDEQLKKVNRIPLIIAAIVVLVAALFFFFLIRGYSNDPYKKTKFSESDRAVISSVFDLENNSFELDTMTYVNENNLETYNVFVKTNDIEQFGETYGLKKMDYYSLDEHPHKTKADICCVVYDGWDNTSYTLWFQYKGHNAELSALYDK